MLGKSTEGQSMNEILRAAGKMDSQRISLNAIEAPDHDEFTGSENDVSSHRDEPSRMPYGANQSMSNSRAFGAQHFAKAA